VRDTAIYFRDRNAAPLSERREGLMLEMRNLCKEWMELSAAKRVRLDMADSGDTLTIFDSRKCRTALLHRLKGVQRDVYLLADQPISPEGIHKALLNKYDRADIDEALEKLTEANLMIFLSNRYLSLALPMDHTLFTLRYLVPLAARKK